MHFNIVVLNQDVDNFTESKVFKHKILYYTTGLTL